MQHRNDHIESLSILAISRLPEVSQSAFGWIAEDSNTMIGGFDHRARQQVAGFARSQPFPDLGDRYRDHVIFVGIESVDYRLGGAE
jgi:hypothetical protein